MDLKQLLKQHGIQIKMLAGHIQQQDGKPYSRPAISRMLHGHLPKGIPPESLWRQIENYLTQHEVNAELIEQAKQTFTYEGFANTTTAKDLDSMSKPTLTQDAKRILGLKHQTPFENDIRKTEDLFLSDQARLVRAHLRHTALNGGFIAIVCEPGGGKSTIADDLETTCRKDHEQVLFIRPDQITVEKLTASGIYDAIIDDVSEGTVRPKRTIEYKSRQARRLLAEAHNNGTRHILLLDEGQGLLPATLKSLKRFWELKVGHENLLGIVIIGQTELKRHLQDDAWNTREVALRCQVVELKPLNAQELADYLRFKFKRIGLDADQFFEPDAYAAIHARLQDGQNSYAYPQRINNLVVRCFNKLAEIGGITKLPADLIGSDLRLRSEV